MGSFKTAAPCEVCGTRVAHHGTSRGFIVGYTIKGVQRLVHNRCRSAWLHQRAQIIGKWSELRPEVLRTLNRALRGRIELFRDLYVEEGMLQPTPTDQSRKSIKLSP